MNKKKELNFKFRFVEEGDAKGFLAKKGSATETTLRLDKKIIGYKKVVDTTTRDNRLIIVLDNNSHIVLEVYKIKALELEIYIDRICSYREAEEYKKNLITEGNEHLYYTKVCPHCKAMINLSELKKTDYIYCRYCESVFDKMRRIISIGDNYRLCDECNLFDRVRSYTEFYFYFLLVIYGYSYKKRHMCDHCAGKIAIKTFLLNLIFILGVPSAIWMKIKSVTGRDPKLKKLAKANALSKKGKYAKAAKIYEGLHDAYRNHPGLLMDEAIGRLIGGDPVEASRLLSLSLDSCSNYFPSLELIERLNKN
jgi:DNA-directed RNA polymerase subunit RPC12/RpoP